MKEPTQSNRVNADTDSNDLISRRMALDAITKKADEELADANHYYLEGIQLAMSVLLGLPSAQPETANIIVGKSRDGMTMWYQCDNCNEPVDENDLYCRGCGRRLEHGSD